MRLNGYTMASFMGPDQYGWRVTLAAFVGLDAHWIRILNIVQRTGQSGSAGSGRLLATAPDPSSLSSVMLSYRVTVQTRQAADVIGSKISQLGGATAHAIRLNFTTVLRTNILGYDGHPPPVEVLAVEQMVAFWLEI